MRQGVLVELISIFALSLTPSTDSSCSLPLDGIWWDSRINGEVTFSSQQATNGWQIFRTVGSTNFDTFSCIESDNRRWVFRSDNSIVYLFGLDYDAFFCLEFTAITTHSYRYYLRANSVGDFRNERVLVVDVTSASGYTSIDQYCSPTNGPDDREYNVLVKKDMQSNIHEEHFPDPLLGVFYYTVSDGTNTFCGTGSVLDACYVNNVIDRTVLSINYTQCSTQLMGSSSGVLFHVSSVYHEMEYFVTVLNSDGQDNLFTCIAVSQTGNERSVSTNPGGCAAGQTSTSRTNSSDSHLLTMTEYVTCLVTTTTSTSTTTPQNSGNSGNNDTVSAACSISSGSGSATAIVAVVLSLLLLIAIIIIAYLIYRNMKSRKSKINHRKSTRGSITETKKPLPLVSDFTLSENPKRSKKMKVENDIIIEPTTPREDLDNLWNESFNGSLTPIPEGTTRPPTSTLWTARSGSSDPYMNTDVPMYENYNLTKLPHHSKPLSGGFSGGLSGLIKPLPPIQKHNKKY